MGFVSRGVGTVAGLKIIYILTEVLAKVWPIVVVIDQLEGLRLA